MEPASAGAPDAAQDDPAVAAEHPGPRQPAAVPRQESPPTMASSKPAHGGLADATTRTWWPAFPGPGQQLQAVMEDDIPIDAEAPTLEITPREQKGSESVAAQPNLGSLTRSTDQRIDLQLVNDEPGFDKPARSDTRSPRLSASAAASKALARPSLFRRMGSNVSSLMDFSSMGSAGSAGSAMRWAAGVVGATTPLGTRRWGPRGPTTDAPRKPREPGQGAKMPGVEDDDEELELDTAKSQKASPRTPKGILKRGTSKRSLCDPGDAQKSAASRWAKIRSNTNNLNALNGVTDSLNKAAELGAMAAAESEVDFGPTLRMLRRSASNVSQKSKLSAGSGISGLSGTTHDPEVEISLNPQNCKISLRRSSSNISIKSHRSHRSNISNSLKAVVEIPNQEVDGLSDELEPNSPLSPVSPFMKSPLGTLISVVSDQRVEQPTSRLQSRLSGLAWLALRISAVVLPLASLLADIFLDDKKLGDALCRGCSAAASLVTLLVILLLSRHGGPTWESEGSSMQDEFPLHVNGHSEFDELDKSSILQQQNELLATAASQLQEVERDLQLWDSLRQEQESLLRGFNKIVTQEVSLNRGQLRVAVIIIESCEETRQAQMELCQLLSYRCEAFPSLEAARVALAEAAPSQCTRSVTSQGGILKDRPKLRRDWRSRVVFQNSGMDDLELWARVVLVGASSLPEELPEQFLDDGNAFVAVTGEVSELDAIAKRSFGVGGKEVREQLRQRGIGECLPHPISKEALGAVVMEAIHTRMREEFLLLENIGQGTSANVFKAKRLRDGAVLALKMVNARSVSKKSREAMEREVQLVRAFRWPTTVFLLDAWVSGKVQCMLFPLLNGGDLRKETQNVAKTGSETPPKWADRVSDWYVQTLHGLSYLHWLGVVHIDIKPANLLLANDRRALLISDFGSAMLLPGKGPHPSRRNFVRNAVYTPAYASPETTFQDMAFAVSDCWSAGASFYEVFTLQCLLPGSEGEPKVLLESLNLDFQETAGDVDPKNLGPAALRWLRKTVQRHAVEGPAAEDLAASVLELLRRDPLQRPSAATLAVHAKTSTRLQAVLSEESAVQDEAALVDHFRDFARLCVESEEAAKLDPPAECFEKSGTKGESTARPLRRSQSTPLSFKE